MCGPSLPVLYEVVHTRVAVRAEPSTQAEILKVEKQGSVVQGVAVSGIGGQWLKVQSNDSRNGFLLVDGASVGLGLLLRRISSCSLQQVHEEETDLKDAPPAEADLRRQPRPQLRNGYMGQFRISQKQVAIRAAATTSAEIVGRLREGDIVTGKLQSDWLLLEDVGSKSSLHPKLAKQKSERWVLVDGSSVGLGLLLQPIVPEPSVKRAFMRAVEIASADPDWHDCVVEVEQGVGNFTIPIKLSVPCVTSGSSQLIHGLAEDADVRLRLVCSSSADESAAPFASKWVTTKTTDAHESMEPFGVDAHGQKRSACANCSCATYVVDDTVGLNTRPEDSRCGVCGCNAQHHCVWEPRAESDTGVAAERCCAIKTEISAVECPIYPEMVRRKSGYLAADSEPVRDNRAEASTQETASEDQQQSLLARFAVVAKIVAVRSAPTTQATAVGRLKCGDTVRGFLHTDWLLLEEGGEHRGVGKQWVLVNGASLGLGVLLQRVVPAPEVAKIFACALELEPIEDACIDCIVEVAHRGDDDDWKIQSTFPYGIAGQMTVRNLEPQTEYAVRNVAKDAGGATGSCTSDWTVVTTRRLLQCWDGHDADVIGTKRGKCSTCNCIGFAAEEGSCSSVSLNMDITACRCSRCGCKAVDHLACFAKKVTLSMPKRLKQVGQIDMIDNGWSKQLSLIDESRSSRNLFEEDLDVSIDELAPL